MVESVLLWQGGLVASNDPLHLRTITTWNGRSIPTQPRDSFSMADPKTHRVLESPSSGAHMRPLVCTSMVSRSICVRFELHCPRGRACEYDSMQLISLSKMLSYHLEAPGHVWLGPQSQDKMSWHQHSHCFAIPCTQVFVMASSEHLSWLSRILRPLELTHAIVPVALLRG